MGIEKPRASRFNVKDEHHNHYSLANHIDVPVHHIISSSFDSLATLHAPRLIAPVHYVVVDQETKSVVVSLRGTLGLSDIVTVWIGWLFWCKAFNFIFFYCVCRI